MKAFVKRVGMVCGLAMGGVALAVNPAFAANTFVQTTDDNPGGYAQWTADGDRWDVCDWQEDGLRASGTLTWSGGSKRMDDANGGSDSSPCASQVVNLPEGTKVTIKVCLRDGANGTARYCDSSTGSA